MFNAIDVQLTARVPVCSEWISQTCQIVGLGEEPWDQSLATALEMGALCALCWAQTEMCSDCAFFSLLPVAARGRRAAAPPGRRGPRASSSAAPRTERRSPPASPALKQPQRRSRSDEKPTYPRSTITYHHHQDLPSWDRGVLEVLSLSLPLDQFVILP